MINATLLKQRSYSRSAYEELSCHWVEYGREFELLTPWLRVTAHCPFFVASDIDLVFQHINSKQIRSEVKKNVSDFLGRFSEFPLSNILPRHRPQDESLSRPLKRDFMRPSQLLELLSQRLTDFQKDAVSHKLLSQIHSIFENDSWSWQNEEILEKSLVIETGDHDPLSAYTLIRRLTLKSTFENPTSFCLSALLPQLKLRNYDHYQQLVLLLLRHNHYVTSRCEEVLEAAVKLEPKGSCIVAEYVASERGHSLLTGRALEALNIEPLNLHEIHPEWVLAMEVLKLAAETDLLAFSCLVAFFEGVPHSKQSIGLADLVQGLPNGHTAAGYLRRHRAINDAAGHTCVAEAMVEVLPNLTASHVRFAAALTDFVSAFMRHFFDKTVVT